jgi:DnaJ-domain-containing protein 1
MGVMRRIADAARTTWERRMRIGEKPLAELTDKELEAELVRRRRIRAAGRGVTSSETSAEASGARAAVQRANVRQWYANLELAPGATVDDVKAAYERLMGRYDPAKHTRDPDKHRAATELARGLREAYEGLLAFLGGQ